jgi:hypothetical protein
MAGPRPLAAGLPWWLLVAGVPAFLGSAILALRLVWEQTVWTWEGGPEMEGFSLVRGPLAPLLLAPFGLVAWLVVAAVLTARRGLRARRIPWKSMIGLGVAAALLGVLSLPAEAIERRRECPGG